MLLYQLFNYFFFDLQYSFISFKDGEEYANIEIPLIYDFEDKEDAFWVELYNQERGTALGLKRTKVVVIKDEGENV